MATDDDVRKNLKTGVIVSMVPIQGSRVERQKGGSMANRGVLRGQLSQAWRKTIKKAYNKQLINTERGLQVYFCMVLLPLLNKHHAPRTLFIEPHVRIGKSSYYPDLVICDSRRVIGVVELKYLPRLSADKVPFAKDVATLLALSTPNEELLIRNMRYLGVGRGRTEYEIADDAVLCWAAVYKADAELPVFSGMQVNDRSRLLALHALTKSGVSPTILPDG